MLPHDLSGGRSRLRLGGKRELVCSPLKKSEPVGQTRHEGKRKPPARHSRSEIAQNDPGNQPGMRERATETAGAAGRARGRKMMRQRNVAGTRSSSSALHSFIQPSLFSCSSDCIPVSANQSGSVDKCAFREISCPIHPSSAADLVQ